MKDFRFFVFANKPIYIDYTNFFIAFLYRLPTNYEIKLTLYGTFAPNRKVDYSVIPRQVNFCKNRTTTTTTNNLTITMFRGKT